MRSPAAPDGGRDEELRDHCDVAEAAVEGVQEVPDLRRLGRGGLQVDDRRDADHRAQQHPVHGHEEPGRDDDVAPHAAWLSSDRRLPEGDDADDPGGEGEHGADAEPLAGRQAFREVAERLLTGDGLEVGPLTRVQEKEQDG